MQSLDHGLRVWLVGGPIADLITQHLLHRLDSSCPCHEYIGLHGLWDPGYVIRESCQQAEAAVILEPMAHIDRVQRRVQSLAKVRGLTADGGQSVQEAGDLREGGSSRHRVGLAMTSCV